MLEQVLDYIHNYFVSDVHVGDFSISSGSISLPFLKNGQRFKIIGSDLNDGIYTYVNGVTRNADGDYDVCLADETREEVPAIDRTLALLRYLWKG